MAGSCSGHVALCISAALLGTGLFGCGSSGPTEAPTEAPTLFPSTTSADPQTTQTTNTTTTTTPDASGMACESDLVIAGHKQMANKGLCIDDTSFFECPHRLMKTWPHTDEPLKYVRLFKAFRPEDNELVTNRTRANFVTFVKANNIKVLVGSQITCNKTDDDLDWHYVKLLLEDLGKDHVLALAVGNELDQLGNNLKGKEKRTCLDMIWDGYLLSETLSRISWVRELLDAPDLPVTSVFTGGILWGADIFSNSADVRVMDFFTGVLDQGERNYVFTFNFYPIFDPSNEVETDDTCDEAMKLSSCYDKSTCKTVVNLFFARQRIDSFVQRNASWDLSTAPFWIGELGWSSPKPTTYDGPMAKCQDFFSKTMLIEYYQSFLRWDLSITGGGNAPDLAFYFTMRDASNFGNQEGFGLVEGCEQSQCKLMQADTVLNRSFSFEV